MLALLAQVCLAGQQAAVVGESDDGPRVETGIEEWPACTVQGAQALFKGNVDLALSVSLACLSNGRQEPTCAYTAACCYANKGDADSALDWLERSLEWKPGGARLIGVDPYLEPLRANPRFAKLVAKSSALEAEDAAQPTRLLPRSAGWGAYFESASSLAGHPLRPVMAVGWEDGCLDIVDLETGRRIKQLSKDWVPQSPVLFLDGGNFVASIIDPVATVMEGPKVVVWDVKSGAQKAAFEFDPGEDRPRVHWWLRMRATQGGDALAILTRAGEAMIARRSGAWEITTSGSDVGPFRDLAWGPKGRLYGIVKGGKLLRLGSAPDSEWTVVSRSLRFTECRGLAVSPSGLEVAVWGDSAGLGLVDVESGRVRVAERATFMGDAGPFYAAYSPNGSRILLTGGLYGAWMISTANLSDVWTVDYGGGAPQALECGFIEAQNLVYIGRDYGKSSAGQILDADDGTLKGVFPSGSWSSVTPVAGGMLSIVKSGVAYSPLKGDGWEVLYCRSIDGHELLVTGDGRFAMSSWAVGSRSTFGPARERLSLASLADELHDPHAVRLLLGSLFSVR